MAQRISQNCQRNPWSKTSFRVPYWPLKSRTQKFSRFLTLLTYQIWHVSLCLSITTKLAVPQTSSLFQCLYYVYNSISSKFHKFISPTDGLRSDLVGQSRESKVTKGTIQICLVEHMCIQLGVHVLHRSTIFIGKKVVT